MPCRSGVDTVPNPIGVLSVSTDATIKKSIFLFRKISLIMTCTQIHIAATINMVHITESPINKTRRPLAWSKSDMQKKPLQRVQYASCHFLVRMQKLQQIYVLFPQVQKLGYLFPISSKQIQPLFFISVHHILIWK